MVNHDDDVDLRRQSKIIAILLKELDYKNHKLIEMEKKHNETVAVQKLLMGLMENINPRERCLLEMECKYNDFLTMVRKLMDERSKTHDRYHNEFQLLKVGNTNMIRDMECLKKEHERLTEELKETKALNDLQQRSFIEEIKRLRRELQDQDLEENNGDLATQLYTFRQQLKGKMERLGHIESMNSSLIVKEFQYKQELVDAREESIKSLQDMFHSRSQLVIKRMGALDTKPFQDVCMQKYPSGNWQEISAQLCSSWEENLKNANWHPYKIVEANGMLQEIVDENDEELKALRIEYGEMVYNAVANALMELQQYNASARYPVSVIWNRKEGRRASLKEVIQYIVKQLNSCKHKRKRN
ncbi:factor of DNA methylation 2-like [Neltuma alba]|uniref:factor of DNA methylation 2-like n=1 Tax=Neltuma alba TaxID=207710 RepID=UPI0010A40937|nr:factor of DNA methylation 2-like [Prosopis alba]